MDRATISRITDRVAGDMEAWQSRPLDAIYPVILVDGIRIKIRDGHVSNRTVYVAMLITVDGERDILALGRPHWRRLREVLDRATHRP